MVGLFILFLLIALDATGLGMSIELRDTSSISFHRQIHPKISPFSGATVESSFDRKIWTFLGGLKCPFRWWTEDKKTFKWILRIRRFRMISFFFGTRLASDCNRRQSEKLSLRVSMEFLWVSWSERWILNPLTLIYSYRDFSSWKFQN